MRAPRMFAIAALMGVSLLGGCGSSSFTGTCQKLRPILNEVVGPIDLTASNLSTTPAASFLSSSVQLQIQVAQVQKWLRGFQPGAKFATAVENVSDRLAEMDHSLRALVTAIEQHGPLAATGRTRRIATDAQGAYVAAEAMIRECKA